LCGNPLQDRCDGQLRLSAQAAGLSAVCLFFGLLAIVLTGNAVIAAELAEISDSRIAPERQPIG
jgi:hypothetical protein